MLPHLQEKEVAPCVVLDRSPRTTGTPKSEELSWVHGGSEKGVELVAFLEASEVLSGLINKAQGLSFLIAHPGGLQQGPLCPSSFLSDSSGGEEPATGSHTALWSKCCVHKRLTPACSACQECFSTLYHLFFSPDSDFKPRARNHFLLCLLIH